MIYDEINHNKNMTLILCSVFFVFVLIFFSIIFGLIFRSSFLGLLISFIISISMVLFSYYFSDSIVLKISNAKEASKKDYHYLHEVVDSLCIGIGLPVPKKYVIEDSALNAFATGRDQEHSVVCITTGLLEKLDRQELEGVIAHELSHIKNYDIRLQTVIVVLVGLVTLVSDLILRMAFRSRGGRSGKGAAILLLIGLPLALLSPVIANIIKLAISRQREYLADASAALLTKNPDGLASALEKISKDKEELEAANNATAHLFFVNPFKNKNFLTNLFSTHPPIQERIARLRKI